MNVYFNDQTSILDIGRLHQWKSIFGDLSNPGAISGVVGWWWDEDDAAKINLGWPSDKAGTLAVRFVRTPLVIESGRAFYQGTDPSTDVDINPDTGDTTISFSGVGVVADQVHLDGTVPRFQLGLGTKAAPPTKWFDVDSATVAGGFMTALELNANTPYDGPDLSSAATPDYVLAAVSDIDRMSRSEKISMSVVFFALAELMAVDDPVESDRNRILFEQTIKDVAPDGRGVSLRTTLPANAVASFGQ